MICYLSLVFRISEANFLVLIIYVFLFNMVVLLTHIISENGCLQKLVCFLWCHLTKGKGLESQNKVQLYLNGLLTVLNLIKTNRHFYTAQIMKFSIKDFFSKCDQICRTLQDQICRTFFVHCEPDPVFCYGYQYHHKFSENLTQVCFKSLYIC